MGQLDKKPLILPSLLRAGMIISVYIGLQGRKQNCSSSFDVLPPLVYLKEMLEGQAGQSPGQISCIRGLTFSLGIAPKGQEQWELSSERQQQSKLLGGSCACSDKLDHMPFSHILPSRGPSKLPSSRCISH